MRVVRIFTRDSGESAIEVREVPMAEAERPMSGTFGCESIFFRETPEGHVQDFHNAPRRQLIFLTSGILELEASDGHRTLCLPGDLIFAETCRARATSRGRCATVRGFVHVTVREDSTSAPGPSWRLEVKTLRPDSSPSAWDSSASRRRRRRAARLAHPRALLGGRARHLHPHRGPEDHRADGQDLRRRERTGAGGRIAWEAAAKSAPDGTTAALIDATYPMLPGLYDKLPWDVAGDLVPAAMIAQTPFVIVVNAGSKLESLAALIAEARARPGKLNFARPAWAASSTS